MLEIYFYNSLTKQRQKFTPLDKNRVKIYACGVTTYDKPHIGHIRSALFADILCRFFMSLGYEVNFIKNFTDIDNKIITRATETGMKWKELSKKMIDIYDQDMQKLKIIPPSTAPLATENIPEMITMIQGLINSGHAYESGGDVFFKVSKAKEYGKLSGKKIDELMAGFRVKLDNKKQSPLDFALWKGAKPGEPFFSSPFGDGLPGWHIECSAMSLKYLGSRFDIHLGGSDLIFPHHENEIAQSESFLGHKNVNYWLHNGMVQLNGAKMSKSTNNFLSSSEAFQNYHPELLRFYLISTHYRSDMSFTNKSITSAGEGLDKLYETLSDINVDGFVNESNFADWQSIVSDEKTPLDYEWLKEFWLALAADLNTPLAIGSLFKASRQINKMGPGKNQKKMKLVLYESAKLLGLMQYDPKSWFATARILQNTDLSTDKIVAYINKRNLARANKDWAKADEIRDFLLSHKIKIKDTKNQSTVWQRIN